MPTLSALGKRWVQAAPDEGARELARMLELHPQVASFLWQHGYREPEQVRAFLDPRLQSLGDPFQLTDLKRAAERVRQAIAAREKMVIFGDYDVDGITSSALLWRVLRKLGANVETFLPLRMEEGYGLSQDGIERCLEQHGPAVLIAVDCGTTATSQVAWLRERGIDVIIIDHHALPPVLPNAHALVNPARDPEIKLDYLASVGLVFKVCHGLLKLMGEGSARVDLRDYLDFVAVGTVADIVPLVEENRVLVRRGLRQLERSHWAGLRALIEVSQVTFPVTAQDVGFRLGPRLNASGRLGDAMRSLRRRARDLPAGRGTVAGALRSRPRLGHRALRCELALGCHRHRRLAAAEALSSAHRRHRPQSGRSGQGQRPQHRRHFPRARAARLCGAPRALRRSRHGRGAQHPRRAGRRLPRELFPQRARAGG
jgi:single-stranded-DNA-specific exonuclease